MKKNAFLSADRAQSLKEKLQNNSDIIIKEIKFNNNQVANLIFIDGITNQEEINMNVIRPITSLKTSKKLNIDDVEKFVVSFSNSSLIDEKDAEEKLLRGYALLFLDRQEKILALNTIEYQNRSIEEPPNSTVIKGPREGFTENIKYNVALMRKRLISNKLKIEDLSLGVRSKTIIKLVYFKDIISNDIIDKIKKRINEIKIDAVLDSNYIAEILSLRPNSLFRQIGTCEKPDIACAKVLEGRVVILVDGSPIALSIPYLLMEDLQSSNDYYSESHRAMTLRILRIVGLVVSMFLPGLYIALQLYHYKALPLKLLVTIVNSTQNLPLNPFLEVFFIIILFDILFEASLRMPKYLGIAVSIVGALILGDTAVKAGLVSPPGVMIVAMSAITIYTVPDQSTQISILRIFFAFIGGVLGFHGLILCSIFLVIYLCNLDSYGTPYLAPYTPYIKADQKDFILKDNILTMKTRPKSLSVKNKTRLKIKKDDKADENE